MYLATGRCPSAQTPEEPAPGCPGLSCPWTVTVMHCVTEKGQAQAVGAPAAPGSLVLQIVLERLRQGQGADVLQALAAQGQADASPAQVHQWQGLGCKEREEG